MGSKPQFPRFHATRSAPTVPAPDTLPWQETGLGDGASPGSRRRRRLGIPLLLLLGGASLLIAVLLLAPWLVRGTPIQPQTNLWAKLALLGAMVALAAVVVVQWRAHRLMARTLREATRALRRGSWEDAVHGLREQPPAAPSVFGDLATQVEDVIGQSERRWRARAELSADWYWETDDQHRLSSMSADAVIVKPAGRALGDLLGRRHDELGFLSPPPQGWTAWHEQLDRQHPFRDVEFEVQGLGSRGQGWIALSGRPRLGRDGRFAGYEGVARDISAPKLSWQRLADSEQRWSVMAGLAADWYWETDEQHRLPTPPAADLLRRFGDIAVRSAGCRRWEVWPDALSPQAWADHIAELDARRPFRGLELAVPRSDGTVQWLSLSGAPRLDAQGRFLGYHGVGRDVTLRKGAEQMLREHNRQLQQAVAARTRELEGANRDLDAFARQLAHELRDPLGQVLGLCDLLRSRLGAQLDPQDGQLLALQANAARGMLGTLEALLELARSTTQAIERRMVDLSAMALEVIAALPDAPRAAPLDWQVQPGLQVWASEPQLRIVLHNLLGNAAKFTRETDAPRVVVDAIDGDNGLTVYRIIDNGAGFDADQARDLFQPFTRLHAGDRFAGTGIGLSIVKRIVQRHGGTIRMEGQPGRGARVEFTLGRRDTARVPGFAGSIGGPGAGAPHDQGR
ncbi:MAG: sensor histidine kinase [Aquabacterium sp.]